MFRLFEEDPFFSGFNERLRGFDSFDSRGPSLAIENKRNAPRSHQLDQYGVEPARRDWRSSELLPHHGTNPFGFMDSMMSNMNSMIGNMFQNMEQMQSDPNGHSFMQSSVMSYSSDGTGKPKIYQATTSSRQAPGGVRETRKAVRDSEVGIEKMSIGRHLNDRAHVMTRERSTRTGEMNENQDYINLDESEAGRFNDEWIRRTGRYGSRQSNVLGGGRVAIDNRSYHDDGYNAPDVRSSSSRKQHRHVKYDV